MGMEEKKEKLAKEVESFIKNFNDLHYLEIREMEVEKVTHYIPVLIDRHIEFDSDEYMKIKIGMIPEDKKFSTTVHIHCFSRQLVVTIKSSECISTITRNI